VEARMSESHQPYAGGSVEDREVEPMRDYGFFAPDSVARRVWSHPSSALIGFARAVTIEHLDPDLAAAVAATGQVKQRTPLRYDRTMQYFATILYGDAQSVLKSSDILMKIHARSVGVDPVTGQEFAANNPDSQLWIHLTAWHSILKCYEMFGPGKLSAADEATYWEECVIAAQFQTIDTETMPRTRADVVAYFDSFRPKMIASEISIDMFDFLTNMHRSSLPPTIPGVIRHPFNMYIRKAIIATMPHWMREMGRVPQSSAVDAAVIATLKPVLTTLWRSSHVMMALLKHTTPRTYPVLAPYFFKMKPLDEKVWTAEEARATFGYRTPREVWDEQLEARAAGRIKAYEQNHHEELLAFDTAGEHGGLVTH
jgi:uncharacterized protein (DUF2236 family)